MLVDNIISGIKSRSIFATNQISIDTDQLLSFLNSIIQLDIVSLIDSCNQEFFVRSVDVPLVASQTRYKIPYRAMGRTLRGLKYFDSQNSNSSDELLLGSQFTFKGDGVILANVSSQVSPTANLQMSYKLKPNSPCLLENAATVVSISSPDITVNQVPTNLFIGTNIDFIQAKEGCDIYSYDIPIINITSNTLTFDPANIPTDLEVGDYISLARTSPVINMIPEECQPLIENKTAKLLLAAIGDMAGSTQFDGWISDMEEMIQKMIEPRTDGNPKVIMNRHGLARGRVWYRSFGGSALS